MTTYVIKEDRFGTRYISREDDGQYIVGADQLRGEVFRAAAAVLAPDEAVVEAMAKAMKAAAGGTAWDVLEQWIRDAWLAQARTALAALRQHAEGSAS